MAASASDPAGSYFAITPSDETALPDGVRGLYIGSVGNLTIKFAGSDDTVLFASVPTGSLLPVRAKYVMSTGTAAGLIVGLV